MRTKVAMSGLSQSSDALMRRMEKANTVAMRECTDGLKEELRDQVFAAGLGRRLAFTWQGEPRPKSGSRLNPYGIVFSKAPKIISLFATGAVIRPVNGSNFLWIPTSAVPHRRGRGAKGRMTPAEVERYYNTDIYVRRGRRGNYLAFVDASAARSTKRFGKATKGPRRKVAEPILVFTLVRQVMGRKLFDPDAAFTRWSARYPGLVEKHWKD